MLDVGCFFISSVAHAAIGELAGVDLILGHQFSPQRQLIGRAPIQIEDLVERTDVFFGRAMAIETPFHIQRVGFPRERHLVQLPVARDAADAMIDVDAVVEKNEVGGLIDPVPAQRLVAGKAVPDRSEDGSIFPDLRMAGHARFGGGHAGEGRFFDGRMTEAAIEAQAEDMMFMAEGHRLGERSHFPSCPRRPINGVQEPAASGNQKPDAENACSRNCIGAPAENLRHNRREFLATAMP